jgi:hypothetical protein
MSNFNKYRVQIPLSDNQTVLVKRWIRKYEKIAVHIWSQSSINDNTLSIHPADFPNLLAHAIQGDCTELEFYRIRKQGALAISQALQDKKSKLSSELHAMVENSLSGYDCVCTNAIYRNDGSGVWKGLESLIEIL